MMDGMNCRSIDASLLEGGGQIVRYAFAVASLLKIPLRVHSIRHNRPKPGLSAQHLTSLQLLKSVCEVNLEGDVMGSTEVSCTPTTEQTSATDFRADAGTAGAISLMIQAILPSLIFGGSAKKKSVLFAGGTNVSFAPPIDTTQYVLSPLLHQMGANFDIQVTHRGYFPRGGGAVRLEVTPVSILSPISLIEQGTIVSAHAVLVTDGPHITSDTVDCIVKEMERSWRSINNDIRLRITTDVKYCSNKKHRGDSSLGILICLKTSTGCVLSTDALLSSRQKSAFARDALSAALCESFNSLQRQISSGACCEEHVADQLLIFMALANGTSRIRVEPKTEKSSLHIETAIEVLSSLCDACFNVRVDDSGCRIIECHGIGYRV